MKTRHTQRRLVLIGDSFAEASAEHFALIADKLNLEFRYLVGYGCPYPLQLRLIGSAAQGFCRNVDEEMLQNALLDGLNTGDIVLVRLHFAKTQYLMYPGTSLPSLESYDTALRILNSAIVARGARLLVVGGNPVLTPSSFASLNRQWYQFSARNDGREETTQETAFFLQNDRHLLQVFSEIPNAHYFSIRPYFCDDRDACIKMHHDKSLYIDEYHISPAAHDLFFAQLLSRIQVLSGIEHVDVIDP